MRHLCRHRRHQGVQLLHLSRVRLAILSLVKALALIRPRFRWPLQQLLPYILLMQSLARSLLWNHLENYLRTGEMITRICRGRQRKCYMDKATLSACVDGLT